MAVVGCRLLPFTAHLCPVRLDHGIYSLRRLRIAKLSYVSGGLKLHTIFGDRCASDTLCVWRSKYVYTEIMTVVDQIVTLP